MRARVIERLTLLLIVAMFVAPSSHGEEDARSTLEPYRTIVDVAGKVLPAVVNIDVVAPEGSWAAAILGEERRGTGFLVDREGHILTASHVVLGASSLKVTLSTGEIIDARMVGLDSESGLALIQIPRREMEPVALGQSKGVNVGEMAIVVGSSGGKERTVNHGIVSAVRPFLGYWEYMLEKSILVSAAITPGFSGGPLINADGKVVGVISFTNSQAQTENIAIPIDLFHEIRSEMITQGRGHASRPRPWLGVYSVPTRRGVMISGITPEGPASRTGLKPRDIVVSVNGKAVSGLGEFYLELWRGKVGDEVELTVMRGGETVSFKVLTQDRELFFR